jgi:hypothetical protein
MRRHAAVLALATMALGTAAGSPDPARVSTDTPARRSADTDATALGLCGLDYSGRASRYTLTPYDVWPTATKTGQAFANHTLDPAVCAHALSVTPNPEPMQCDLDFPFSPDDERVTELARAVVPFMNTAQLFVLDSVTIVSATVREVILGLGVDAATKFTRLARVCGAKAPSGALATTVIRAIDMAAVVQDNRAGALSSAGHTRLSELGQIALQHQPATLADR